MKARSYYLFAFCLLAAAAVFLFRGRGDSESPPSEGGIGGGGSLSERSPGDHRRDGSGGRNPGESEEDRELREIQVGEARDQLVGQMVQTASEGFSKARKELVADLALSATQSSALSEIFQRREVELARLLNGSDQPFSGNEGEAVEKICALIRQQGLRDELVGLLSEEQLEAFDRREEKRVQSRIEARTYRDLAQVNEAVALAEDQKQEVFDALMKSAPQKVEEEANARAFMSLTYGPLASEMDPSFFRGMADLMNTQGGGQPDSQLGSEEHVSWLKERKAERMSQALAALADVLNPEQLTQYREHLESQSPW